MNILTKFAVLVMVFGGLAGFVVIVPTVVADEHEAEVTQTQEADEAENEEQPEQEQAEDQEQGDTYSYTAQAGDSYTVLARKAVQTHGLVNDVELSQAQIIFAETRLTQAANSPELAVGQAVEINESAVEDWVKAAQELSEEQEALWQQYVPGVDFNTDNNGEAQTN